MFRKIKVSTFKLICDPFVSCCCSTLCNLRKQKKLLEKVESRIAEELDVEILLKKIRDNHDMLKYLGSKNVLKLLDFNKRRVVGSSSSAESSESSNDEEDDFKQKMEKSIVKGIPLPKEDRKVLLAEIRRAKAKKMFKLIKDKSLKTED